MKRLRGPLFGGPGLIHGWETFSMENHIENFIATGAAYITFVSFSYNLRFKIWFNDDIVINLHSFILYFNIKNAVSNETCGINSREF